jgi:hypothetical protein
MGRSPAGYVRLGFDNDSTACEQVSHDRTNADATRKPGDGKPVVSGSGSAKRRSFREKPRPGGGKFSFPVCRGVVKPAILKEVSTGISKDVG